MFLLRHLTLAAASRCEFATRALQFATVDINSSSRDNDEEEEHDQKSDRLCFTSVILTATPTDREQLCSTLKEIHPPPLPREYLTAKS